MSKSNIISPRRFNCKPSKGEIAGYSDVQLLDFADELCFLVECGKKVDISNFTFCFNNILDRKNEYMGCSTCVDTRVKELRLAIEFERSLMKDNNGK